jgi:hypothetical protein
MKLFPRKGLAEFDVRYSPLFFREVVGHHLRALKRLADAKSVFYVPHRMGFSADPPAALFFDFVHTRPAGNLHIARDIAKFLKTRGLLVQVRPANG